MIGTFIVSLILAFSSAGFPYSGSIAEPRVQRHYLTHTQRTFFNADGTIKYTDKGFFIKENERNSKRTLDTIFDPKKLLPKNDDVWCQTEAFCGFPSYNSSNAFWMVANKAPEIPKVNLKLTSKLVNGNDIVMSFDVVGSLLTLLFVVPENSVEIVETSVGFSEREWAEGKVAKYLKVTHGKASSDPFSFTLKMRKSTDSDLLKITVVTIDSHFDKFPAVQEFQDVIDKFPDYVFVQQHQADVSSYAFK